MNKCKTLILTLLFTEGVMSPVAAQQLLLQPESRPISDRFLQRVPVSGHTLVGVLRTHGPELASSTGLGDGTIAVLGAVKDSVCVRVTTQDGRYSAENTFTTAGKHAEAANQAGATPLAWPSQQPKQVLDAIKLGELAVLTINGPCGQTGTVVVPSTIGSSGAASDAFLQVIANSHGAATWAVLRDPTQGGPALRRVRCIRSEIGDRVAFDSVCPLGPAPDGVSTLELRLEQQGRDGRSTEIVERVTLSMPDGTAKHP